MPEKEARDVQSMIESEGFHYGFRWKTDFKNIRDARFHELLRAYLDAAKTLADYVGVEE